jgi:DNA primase
MIDHATVERILDAAQIVDVVSDFVTLRKRGVNFVGLCPFHDDKTPSFYVSPSKGICKCFACGKGGNSAQFIMEHEQLSYPEALKYLAKKYGIEVKERELSDEEKIQQNERESLFVVNSFACDYFRNTLKNHIDGRSIGMAYFRGRGFRDDIIEKFQLGYATDSRDALAQEALKKGYKAEFLLKTGLCYENDNHRLRDRFWGRVIFPVHTLSGKVVAFGGRVLDSATKGVSQKYVNSPESDIYHKSNELYGIYFAKQAIVKQDRCILVEGYTDVISMHQSGVENVVASSGTALTTHQIKLIHRFTNNITVLYDGDIAGIKASIRGIDMLLEEGMNIRVCLLPDGDDPDSFARKHTAEEFRSFLAANEKDFIRFKTGLLLEESDKDPIKRAELISNLVQTISVIPEDIVRDVYIRECAQLLNVREKLLVSEVAKRREANHKPKPKPQTEQTPTTPATGALPTETAPITPTTDAAGEQVTGTPAPEYVSFIPQEGNEGQEFYVYERHILKALILYGEQTLCTLSDEESGEEHDVKVIDYIAADLKQDDISFHNPLYRRILAEAVEHLHDEGFTAERYFLSHPDTAISKLSTDLMSERYHLSKYHTKIQKIVNDKERLYELVPTLVTRFKFAIVDKELEHIIRKLQDPEVAHDEVRCTELMQRYQSLRDVQVLMAKHLGDRVVLKG